MTDFFYQTILPLTMAGSAALLLLLALTPAAKRLSHTWQYYLRFAAAVLFLTPLPFSLPRFRQQPGAAEIVRTPVEALADMGELLSDAARQPLSESHVMPLPQLLVIIWAVGAAVFSLHRLYVWVRFCRFTKAVSTPVTDRSVLGLLEICKRHKAVRVPVKLKICPHVGGPVLIGALHPTILLPGEDIPERELRLILTHELTHCKRKDLLYKLVLLAVRTLHWFNPLVHLLSKQAGELCELSCDEAVVRGMNGTQRKEYGLTILNRMEATLCGCPDISSSFSVGKEKLKRRLQFIVNLNQPKNRLLLGVCLAAAVSVTGIIVACALNGDSAALPQDTLKTVGMTAPDANSGTDLMLPENIEPDEPAEQELTQEQINQVVQEELAKAKLENELTEEEKTKVEALSWMKPADGYIGASVWTYEGHTGIDLAAKQGTDIYAAADGTVQQAEQGVTGYGNCLVISHGDQISTLYGHCEELLVEVGDVVRKGDKIATVGRTGAATGYHCHVELRVGGKYADLMEFVGEK